MKSTLIALVTLLLLAPTGSSALTSSVRVAYTDGDFGEAACDLPFRVCMDVPAGTTSTAIRFFDDLATAWTGAGSGFWFLLDANGEKVESCYETSGGYGGGTVTVCNDLGGHFCDRVGFAVPEDAAQVVVDIDRNRAASATCLASGEYAVAATSGELRFNFYDN